MASLSDLLDSLGRSRKASPAPARNPYLEGNFAPVGREGDFPSLEVRSGEVPRDLRGALYRTSPGPRFEPVRRDLYHWFDGDGVIDAFHIEDGGVSHKNRWVRTEKLALEEHAGRALFGGILDFATSTGPEGWLALGFKPLELLGMRARALLGLHPTEEQMKRMMRAHDRSNTSIVHMAGRLLTLIESSAAHEIDPKTLATRGRFTFGGVVDGLRSMVAHPKIDPETGTIYTFGYWLGQPGLTYYVFGADGESRLVRDIETTYPSMMHDFSVTETRAIFYHLPAVLHFGDAKTTNTVRWQPSRGARIGVTLRDDPKAPVRWFDIPPCYIYHPMNAFDDGAAVVLDVVRYPRVPLFDPGGELANPNVEEYPPAQLVRIRIDLETGAITESSFDDVPVEFPVVDPRRATRRYRYGWTAARRGVTCGRGSMNAIARFDVETGEVKYRTLGRSSYTLEPIFVPRSPDAPEGDGYLLAVVYHAQEDASDLLILDAIDIEREPIAVVRTRQRVPYGFHGTWVPTA
ncbi:carotenoid oxygenase family protein [Polyangium aurulentum]|uniref:carotenoid oxygenase family protein n=1 Tax=Polyangium aurulentum TaxID=2567896 RepID=UPI0010AE61C4|nr:carotenoid oxygenase family protein [Polyangium aurulentum]UQA61635.1 carotenoid oxygenase family protein [Polyangium aurulentum]